MSPPPAAHVGGLRLGLRANLAQFSLLAGVNALVGGMVAGVVADLAGLEAAVWVVAALTATSGLVVAGRMYETHRPARQP